MSSLYPDDGHRKGHSRSQSRDGRSRDDHAPKPPAQYADVREPSYIYPEDDLDDRYKGHPEAQASGALPYPEEGGIHFPGEQNLYGYDSQKPIYKAASPPSDSPYRSSHERVNSGSGLLPGAFPDEGPRGKGKDEEPRTRFGDHHETRREDKPNDRREDKTESRPDEKEDKLKFLPQKYIRKFMSGDSDKESNEGKTGKDRDQDDLAYGKPPVPKRPVKQSDDLAYGKAVGIPATASQTTTSSQTLTTYGGNPPEEHKDGRRDEKRDEKKYYEEHDERYYERPDDRYYDDRYDDDKRDERRDERRARRREEKRVSKYAEREESTERRHPAEEYDYRRYEERDERNTYAADERNTRRRGDSIRNDTYSASANVLTVDPGSHDGHDRERSRDRRHRHHRERSSSDLLAVDGHHKRDKSKSRDKSRDKSRERSRDRRKDKSPSRNKLTVETSSRRERSRSRDGRGPASLAVATGGIAGLSLAAGAPASPLLESYYGTYQDCSPMPSPLLLASRNPNDDLKALEPLSPSGSDLDSDGKKRGRRARFHDAEDITTQLAHALRGSKHPDTAPLIEILPSLTHEQVMELRAEYKRIVKTGSDRKGVNVAKHIRARLKDEDPLLMKACYAVALGMWESEAYWANFWYQGDKTRRELLIESLMGRTNAEIRAIKDSFSDKKYDNSLIKCMKTELKEDKFKKAVLMVLDECRMEEYDGYGRVIPIDYELVDHDVSELRRALKSEKGGETAMITIVVQRSDSHLRAVLQEYERGYRSNFARDALKKSGNLVGELLAHILNGVINRPVRDALLLHHAITASRKDGLRRELLISRLVRYHWDPQHMRAVKQAYRDRYGKGLQDALREATSGEWGLFCRELCIARTPDDVRKFEKVAVSGY